jgi:hypothetical protein
MEMEPSVAVLQIALYRAPYRLFGGRRPFLLDEEFRLALRARPESGLTAMVSI